MLTVTQNYYFLTRSTTLFIRECTCNDNTFSLRLNYGVVSRTNINLVTYNILVYNCNVFTAIVVQESSLLICRYV